MCRFKRLSRAFWNLHKQSRCQNYSLLLINLFVGSYDCICKNGFEPGEEYCVDKNECTNGQSKCSEKVQKLLNNVNVLITYNRYYNNFNCILLILLLLSSLLLPKYTTLQTSNYIDCLFLTYIWIKFQLSKSQKNA